MYEKQTIRDVEIPRRTRNASSAQSLRPAFETLIFQGFFLFTRITGQSPHLHETLATVAIIRKLAKRVSFVYQGISITKGHDVPMRCTCGRRKIGVGDRARREEKAVR